MDLSALPESVDDLSVSPLICGSTAAECGPNGIQPTDALHAVNVAEYTTLCGESVSFVFVDMPFPLAGSAWVCESCRAKATYAEKAA